MQVFPVSDTLCIELCADPNPIFQHLSHLNQASTPNLHLILWNDMGGGGGGGAKHRTYMRGCCHFFSCSVWGGGGGGVILCAQAFVCVVVSQCVCDYIVDGWIWNARVVCIYSSGPPPKKQTNKTTPLFSFLRWIFVKHILLECPITTELFQKNGYDLHAYNNVRDILYNNDIITNIVKSIVHSPVGKLV